MDNYVYVVTEVECGDSCTGHPSCYGVFKDKSDAKNYVYEELKSRGEQLSECDDVQVDYNELEILDSCDQPICMWSIDSVEIK